MQQMFEVLEAVDLDLNRKDMIVLGALLKAQSEPTSFVEFDSLREQLARDEGGKKGKDSLIYRSLSWLEQSGLIQVDRSRHKHGYNSNVGMMHRVLKRLMVDKSSTLAKELKQLDSEINLLSEINASTLAADMISLAAGSQPVEKTIFVQRWENILRVLDSKVYRNLKKNDIIRFTLEWYDRPENAEKPRVLNIESLLKAGVEIRGIEHRKLKKERVQRYARLFDYFRQKGYKVGFRLCIREDSTYQFIGRNSEGILLIVSENPLSATWLPRSANPELVDNAIQSFDRDYLEGTDISLHEGGLEHDTK
jgi:predicted transcriptional regulator